MAINDNAIQELIGAIAPDTQKKKSSTYAATVSRIDGEGTVWVNIAGSEKETPTATSSAEVKPGDAVTVEWRNNKLYIAGNLSNPSAGVVRMTTVEQVAQVAKNLAAEASASAETARTAAESAVASAGIAATKADEAKASADEAQSQAVSATAYANSALDQLGIVQDVVGVLDLLSKNGNYELTEDTEVVEGKWYFTRNGEPPNYEYIVVATPLGDPHDQGWYELTSIEESVRSYLTSRIAVTSDGMWIQDPTMSTKILLSPTDGVVLIGADGSTIGKYGSTVQIGDENGFHIQMDGSELGFYQAGNKVAYINNNQLYITQSVVLQQMDLGEPVASGGLGQWSWKVHANGQNPSRNNLNLKWIG